MCFNHYERNYENMHPEYRAKKRVRSRTWHQDNIEREKKIHQQPRYRFNNFVRCAKIRHLEVDIDFQQWSDLVLGKVCTYCGGLLPIQGSAVDRKDSTRGYMPDNVVPCCTICNQVRGHDNISYEEMKYVMPLLVAWRESHKI
jgi:hypothetical protein